MDATDKNPKVNIIATQYILLYSLKIFSTSNLYSLFKNFISKLFLKRKKLSLATSRVFVKNASLHTR